MDRNTLTIGMAFSLTLVAAGPGCTSSFSKGDDPGDAADAESSEGGRRVIEDGDVDPDPPGPSIADGMPKEREGGSAGVVADAGPEDAGPEDAGPEDGGAMQDTCAAIDPGSYGDCGIALGAGFDGSGCVYVSGCGCGDACDKLFGTLEGCREGCSRSCADIDTDLAAFVASNRPCQTSTDCTTTFSVQPKYIDDSSCTIYLSKAADLSVWVSLSTEWRLVPNGGGPGCADPFGVSCTDNVPPAPACSSGVCGPAGECPLGCWCENGPVVCPDDDRFRCESTGGVWDSGSCGHYRCGQPPLELCVDPGCDCTEGRNFVDGVGCEFDNTCSAPCPAASDGCNRVVGSIDGEVFSIADVGVGWGDVTHSVTLANYLFPGGWPPAEPGDPGDRALTVVFVESNPALAYSNAYWYPDGHSYGLRTSASSGSGITDIYQYGSRLRGTFDVWFGDEHICGCFDAVQP